MTTIDRTAYPQFHKPLTEIELADCYHISDDERDFVYHNARTQRGRLSLAVVLKTRQLAGRFLTIENTPEPSLCQPSCRV